MFHKSVLLHESIESLQVEAGKVFIDATLGGGGHSLSILEHGGQVLGIDQDEESIAYVASRITDPKLTVVRGNFREIGRIARENGFQAVNGVLFDVGVSSHQVDEGERGFSFLQEARLDMRMDSNLEVTAGDLVNGLHKGELEEIFKKFGEENYAKKIAHFIVEVRKKKRIETTHELAEIVVRVYPKGLHKVHPATKVFQALRIVVNDELHSLEEAMPQAVELLKPGGRLVVISFHSLEDRIVKHAFLEFEMQGLGKILTTKPVVPGSIEEEENRRARSAKMRVFEKSV